MRVVMVGAGYVGLVLGVVCVDKDLTKNDTKGCKRLSGCDLLAAQGNLGKMKQKLTFRSSTERSIFENLSENGPMTGQELSNCLKKIDPLEIWKVCYQSNLLRITGFSRYYLRYDITRNNQLRLSPSILRDFLTYSLIFKRSQRTMAVEKGARLANSHRAISNRKIGFARKAILSLEEDTRTALNESACFFISGDLSYYLGHDVPRIHAQLETPINGSDIDIVIVYNTEAEPALIKAAEEQMLKIKYRALKSPEIREEIDFIFKPVSKLITQLQYRDIHEKIASKILYESFYLYGRLDIYEHLLGQMDVLGTKKKIEDDFDVALSERKQTIGRILDLEQPLVLSEDPEVQSLFFFSQEKLEFQ